MKNKSSGHRKKSQKPKDNMLQLQQLTRYPYTIAQPHQSGTALDFILY